MMDVFTIEVSVPGEKDPWLVSVMVPDGDMSAAEIGPYTLAKFGLTIQKFRSFCDTFRQLHTSIGLRRRRWEAKDHWPRFGSLSTVE